MVQLPLQGDVLVSDAQRAPIHVSSCLSLVKRPCNVADVWDLRESICSRITYILMELGIILVHASAPTRRAVWLV